MSLFYNCWFSGPAPDLHQLLNELTDEYIDEVPEAKTEDKYLFFYESSGTFYLYYNGENDEGERAENEADEKPVLAIYPNTRAGTYALAFGNFEVQSSWYIPYDKFNMSQADVAFARLLRGIVKHYVGDFVSLFYGEQVLLYRTNGVLHLNRLGCLAEEPLLSLLKLPAYELETHEIV